nr:putative methylesterase 12, chloroplastic [Tanacetum cinerariifolium]
FYTPSSRFHQSPSFDYHRLKKHKSSTYQIDETPSFDLCKKGEKEAISWRGVYINAAMMMSYLDRQKAEVVVRICRVKAGREIEENAVIHDLGQIGFRRALFDFPSSFMHAVNEKSHPWFWSNSEQLCGYEPPDLRLQLSRRAADHRNCQPATIGSMSRRIGSTSSRRIKNGDPQPNTTPKQLKPSPEVLENLETKKIVLIHGEGFGAWCWYKSIALLEESGMVPTALDLTGSGIDLKDTNNVTTLEEYSKPLIDYMQNLPEDDKVLLVGHSSGGACVSYALEHFQHKISKAVFLCGTMVADGQKPFDVFAEELGSAELFMKESKFLIHGNGKDNPPTGFMFEKQQMRGLYFNQSPAKDIALAMVSVRPIPLGPIMENLSLTKEKYGKGRRFYIQTLDDHALSPDTQEKLVRENPPEGVFKIKVSLTMSEEGQNIDVGELPKFDMPLYSSEMTAKDIKSLALRHGIVPTVNSFHIFYKISKQGHWFSFEKRVGKGAGVQIFRETFSGLKGWKKRVLFLDRRAIPDAMAWRHHDFDVNGPILEDGFNASDVPMLTEHVIDLRPVPFGLLFLGGLATTWEFPGFRPVFKDIVGNVVTMSEYLCFPFLSGASISKGPPLTSQDQIVQHTTPPLPSARAAAKKREKRRQCGDGGVGSRPATKRTKIAARKDGVVPSEATSSPKLLQTINPTGPSGDVTETAESREDHLPRTFGDPSGKAKTTVNTEVVRPSTSHQSAHHSPVATQSASPMRSIQRGNVAEGESSRRGSFYVPDWSIH